MEKLGWIGYGAFGRLACGHLGAHFHLVIHDAQPSRNASASLEEVAACPRIVIAAPVQAIGDVAKALAPLKLPQHAVGNSIAICDDDEAYQQQVMFHDVLGKRWRRVKDFYHQIPKIKRKYSIHT